MNKNYITRKAKEAIAFNEVGADQNLIYRFSDPDGESTGKSGWSFGRSQFDTRNNWDAIICLKVCGFTVKEAISVVEQTASPEVMALLNKKLLAAHKVVDSFDQAHINNSVTHCMALVEGYAVKLASEAVMVHIVDYHNQFYMSKGGKLHKWLQAQQEAVTSEMVLNFKLEQTRWGRIRPDDVTRRWRNIERIMGG